MHYLTLVDKLLKVISTEMLIPIKHLSYLLMFSGFLSKSQALSTSAATDKIFGSYQINKQQPRSINSKVKEQAKQKAIAEMKLKNGCTKPDTKKIAAARAAEKKYKKPGK